MQPPANAMTVDVEDWFQVQAYAGAIHRDADHRSFFDVVSQEWLARLVEHLVGDKRIDRRIRKWLKAGILEDRMVTVGDRMTGRSTTTSPPPADIYRHHVLDLWAECW